MDNNAEKYLVIPLTNLRDIKIRFYKINDRQWECVASDDFLKDMEVFFENGYYELDPARQLSVINNEQSTI